MGSSKRFSKRRRHWTVSKVDDVACVGIDTGDIFTFCIIPGASKVSIYITFEPLIQVLLEGDTTLSGLFEVLDNVFGSLFMGELRVDAESCTVMDCSEDIRMSLTGKIV